jgi:hypothetical protein
MIGFFLLHIVAYERMMRSFVAYDRSMRLKGPIMRVLSLAVHVHILPDVIIYHTGSLC